MIAVIDASFIPKSGKQTEALTSVNLTKLACLAEHDSEESSAVRAEVWMVGDSGSQGIQNDHTMSALPHAYGVE